MAYDLLLSKLDAKRQDRFVQACETLLNAVTEGEIANPVFKDAKERIDRVLYDAYKTVALETLSRAKDEAAQKAENIAYYASPTLHTVPGLIRKLEAIKLDLPIKTACLALLREIAPVAEAAKAIKDGDMIIKRQPKPVEDRKAKYQAPEASLGAIGQVKALLEQVTQEARDALLADLVRIYTAYLTAFQTAKAEKPGLKVYDFFMRRNSQHFDPDAYHLVSRLYTVSYEAESFGQEVLRADHAATILTEATTLADDIRENFVFKNLKKLDSIVEAKGNFLRAEVVGHHISLGGLSGTFRFFFADGSRFTCENSVVWSRSVHNRPFQRFPLTFHDAILPGGAKLPRPSEERMNTLFVGKAG